MSPIIRVEKVSKKFRIYSDKGTTLKERLLFKKRRTYKEQIVLNNISFTVEKGEAVGLIGQNVPRYEQETGSLFRHLQLWRELYT